MNINMDLENESPASKPYDIVIVEMGNGEWYHGFENPLAHRWHINGDRATCLICHKVIEKRFRT